MQEDLAIIKRGTDEILTEPDLKKKLAKDRESYEKFWENFGALRAPKGFPYGAGRSWPGCAGLGQEFFIGHIEFFLLGQRI